MSGDTQQEALVLETSGRFPELLLSAQCSIAFTTYQAGKLFMLGLQPDGRLSIFERTFPRSMGLGVSTDGRTLALATHYQVHRFDNVVAHGETGPDGYDAVYAPHAAWVTGDVDAHDVALDSNHRPIFVNTLFSCIAAVADGHSFKPIWTPRFVSNLAPEDRCHLNGFAVEAAVPRFATAVSRSDVADGWRDRRADGGVVMDVSSGDIVVEGLSMPHSPRLHRNKLWVLNSGAGEFGYVDLTSGKFEAIAFCPGYARGLTFIGDFAVVGLSLARDDRTFAGLPLDNALLARHADARCGLAIYDLNSGNMTAWLRIGGVVRELYDVVVLPGVVRPMLIGFKSDDVHRVISIDE